MDRRGSNVAQVLVPPAPPERDEVAVAVARRAFSAWLRAAREARGIGLEEVARITKIQLRTLERLEEAAFNELPADVFVRGFIRNYARVVGLNANDAIARYDDCGVTPGPAASAKANAFVEIFQIEPTPLPGISSVGVVKRTPQADHPLGGRLADHSLGGRLADHPLGGRLADHPLGGRLAQSTPSTGVSMTQIPTPVATPVVFVAPPPEPEPVAESAGEPVGDDRPKRKRGKRGGKNRKKRPSLPPAIAEVVVAAPEIDEPKVDEPKIDAIDDLEVEITIIEEPAPVVVAPISVSRRISVPLPSLVIDDDDPDSAERVREARSAKDKARSFLPQALLDSDRAGRQGGLTLAVIILLIVATLTLSYLMRRPSAGGEGVTMGSAPSADVLV